MTASFRCRWPIRKVGELCTVSRGSSPRPIRDQRYFEGGTIPWIKIADATKSGKFLHKTKQYVNEYGASFSRLLPAGTILVAASGTLGYTQILGVQGCAHDGWLILTELNGLDRDFAYYTMQLMERHFFNAAYGAAIQNINTEILQETEIPCPDIKIQRRIASILSAYDDLIENNSRRIQILEEMAQRIYTEWFVHFRFPGHEKVKMVDSDLGRIPIGWEIGQLKDVASVNEKSVNKGNAPDSIRYIDIKSVSTGRINQVRVLPFSEAPGRARRVIRSQDIIWATVRPNLRAYVLILEPAPNTIASTGFAVITPKRLPYTYLYCHLTTDAFVEYLVNHATGSAYPAVNQNDFKNSTVLMPDEINVKTFHDLTDPFQYQVHVLMEKNTNLRQTRDLLLPKLISGEIDVSDILVPEEIAA